MIMFDDLTTLERDLLWWRLYGAAQSLADELAALGKRAPEVRDFLYGEGILQRMQGVRDDVTGLLDDLSDGPLIMAEWPENDGPEWREDELYRRQGDAAPANPPELIDLGDGGDGNGMAN